MSANGEVNQHNYNNQQFQYQDESGLRRGDEIKVDKLIPDEADLMQNEAQQQMFLLQQ